MAAGLAAPVMIIVPLTATILPMTSIPVLRHRSSRLSLSFRLMELHPTRLQLPLPPEPMHHPPRRHHHHHRHQGSEREQQQESEWVLDLVSLSLQQLPHCYTFATDVRRIRNYRKAVL